MKKGCCYHSKGSGEILVLNKVNAHKLIGRMEKSGWLKIKPHPHDKRCKIVTITPEEGRLIPLLKKTDKKVSQKLSKICDSFDGSVIRKGKDENFVRVLYSILLQGLK